MCVVAGPQVAEGAPGVARAGLEPVTPLQALARAEHGTCVRDPPRRQNPKRRTCVGGGDAASAFSAISTSFSHADPPPAHHRQRIGILMHGRSGPAAHLHGGTLAEAWPTKAATRPPMDTIHFRKCCRRSCSSGQGHRSRDHHCPTRIVWRPQDNAQESEYSPLSLASSRAATSSSSRTRTRLGNKPIRQLAIAGW